MWPDGVATTRSRAVIPYCVVVKASAETACGKTKVWEKDWTSRAAGDWALTSELQKKHG